MESLNLSTIKQDTHLLVINQLQFNQLMGNHKLIHKLKANNQFMPASHLHNTVSKLHLHSTHNLYSIKQDIHKAKLHHSSNSGEDLSKVPPSTIEEWMNNAADVSPLSADLWLSVSWTGVKLLVA
mgnify:CR=1 FL=1